VFYYNDGTVGRKERLSNSFLLYVQVASGYHGNTNIKTY